MWREPFLRAAVGVIGGMNFVFNALTLVLIVRARSLGASSTMVGVMFGFYGVGGLLGSFVAPCVQRRFAGRQVVVTIAWFWVAQTAVLVLMPSALTLGVVSGLGALAGPAFNVVVNSHVYKVTPDRLLGRVRRAAKVVAWGSIPLRSLTAGFLAAGYGAGPALLVLAAGMLVVAVAATLAPGMRHLAPPDRDGLRQAR